MSETTRVNRETFVAMLSKKVGLTLAKTDETVIAFLDTVHELLAQGKAIVFRPYGSFKMKKRSAKTGIDPYGNKYSSKGKLVVDWEPFCKGKKEC